MSPLVNTFIFVLSLINYSFAQSLVQEPASTLANLSIDADIDRFTPAFGGIPLNVTSNTRPHCFTNTPGFPQFRKVVRLDCYYLFFNILVTPSATTPYRWESAKQPLATLYKYGHCAVSVYAASLTSKEVFTQLGIARVAALVVQDCVTAPKDFLGGKLPIGDTNGFWVAVGQQ
ncbi:MAG: hypothetical protein Q9225_005769 [Loekoesia sp. 1 TL-2023]